MTISGVLEEQGGWYEDTLSLKERRSRGHFSTPPRLVDLILDACGYTPDNELTGMRVLDPACGSGNFLAGAAHRLALFAARTGLSQEELSVLISSNIWGFDPDPISCFLAEMQLRSMACLPLLLHIHQADGLALSWGNEPCVDLFLANPPYLAAKNIDLSGYRSARQRGQADSYLLFLSLGLQVVRPGGWVGLVLPDPVLARTNAAQERAHLLKEFTIHSLWHLSDVFAAQVGAVVIIAQKTPPLSTHQVSWVRGKWEKEKNSGIPGENPARQVLARDSRIEQSIFLRQPGAELRYLLGSDSEQGSTIERMRTYFEETTASHRSLAPLSEFLSIRRGEELGRASVQLVHRQMACPRPAKEDPTVQHFTDGREDNSAWYPVLRGGRDIRPYATSFSDWWIAREAISKPLERYLSPKLLVVKSTDRLQSALDMQGHVALQTLYLLHLRSPNDAAASTRGQAERNEEDDLYFYLALLNSRLLRAYVYALHTAYKWVQPQIEQRVLARLPIPIAAPDEKEQIINRAKLLVRACSEAGPVVEWKEPMQCLYEEQELAIRALYDCALM